jgi:hypothetical protein
MLTTIADVKAVANKLYPSAAKLSVQRIDPATSKADAYRLFAVDANNRMLGRISAPSLNDLRERIQKRLAGHANQTDNTE